MDLFSIDLYPLTYKTQHKFGTIQGKILTAIFYIFALFFFIYMTIKYSSAGSDNISIQEDTIDLKFAKDKSQLTKLEINLNEIATFYMVPYQEVWKEGKFIFDFYDDDLSYDNYFGSLHDNKLIIKTYKNDLLIEEKQVSLQSICKKEQILVSLQEFRSCKIDLKSVDLQKPKLTLGPDDTFKISMEKPDLCCLPQAPSTEDSMDGMDGMRNLQMDGMETRPMDPQKMVTVMLINETMIDQNGETYNNDFRVLDIYKTEAMKVNTYPVFYYNKRFQIQKGSLSQSNDIFDTLAIYKKEDPRQGQGFSEKNIPMGQGLTSRVVEIKFFNRQLIKQYKVQEKLYQDQLAVIFSMVLMALSFFTNIGTAWNHRQFKNLQQSKGMLQTLDMELISKVSEKTISSQKKIDDNSIVSLKSPKHERTNSNKIVPVNETEAQTLKSRQNSQQITIEQKMSYSDISGTTQGQKQNNQIQE